MLLSLVPPLCLMLLDLALNPEGIQAIDFERKRVYTLQVDQLELLQGKLLTPLLELNPLLLDRLQQVLSWMLVINQQELLNRS